MRRKAQTAVGYASGVIAPVMPGYMQKSKNSAAGRGGRVRMGWCGAGRGGVGRV